MKRTALVAVCLLILTSIVVSPALSMQRGRGAPPEPTNLQILPQDVDIRMVMQNMSMALGVTCTYCHIQGEFASDEIDKKEIARTMMRMMQTINNDFLASMDARVNCATCHRGSAIPSP